MKNKVIRTSFKEKYKDGRLKEKGTLIDGVKQGTFVFYKYLNATKPKKVKLNKYINATYLGKPYRKRKTIGTYKDGRANGDYKIFENNVLVEEGTFVNDLAQGAFKEYRPHYASKNNIINRVLSFYYRKKRKAGLFIEGNYKDGLFHGELRFEGLPWEEDEFSICNFCEGWEDGTQTVWGKDGQIRSTLEWKKGKKHGVEKEYFRNGRLRSLRTFKEGELHGLKQEFYEDGRLESQWTWKNGILHGPYRERDFNDDEDFGWLQLERGNYFNGEKKGKYIRYIGDLPFKPKKGKDDPNWERGIHK